MDFRVGDQVKVAGLGELTGTVTEVNDGRLTTYAVTYDGGLGHGTHEASEMYHLASDDYPELGDILYERPTPETAIKLTGAQHVADAMSIGTSTPASTGDPENRRTDLEAIHNPGIINVPRGTICPLCGHNPVEISVDHTAVCSWCAAHRYGLAINTPIEQEFGMTTATLHEADSNIDGSYLTDHQRRVLDRSDLGPRPSAVPVHSPCPTCSHDHDSGHQYPSKECACTDQSCRCHKRYQQAKGFDAIGRTAAKERFYHGTRWTFKPGDLLHPGGGVSSWGGGQTEPFVYTTKRHDIAREFAEDGNGPPGDPDARPKVYEVEHTGPHELDRIEHHDLQCYQSPHPVRIIREVRRSPRTAAKDIEVAGVAVLAEDTGRVLFLQRSNDDEEDPARGTFEFPGGHIEGKESAIEGAVREWKEELGCPLPDGDFCGSWVSTNGIYQCFVYCVPNEDDVEINLAHKERKFLNPDVKGKNPKYEIALWMDPKQAKGMPNLRKEVKEQTDWSVFRGLTKKGMAWQDWGEGRGGMSAEQAQARSVRDAGFKGYVSHSDHDEEHTSDDWDDDLWDKHTPEPTHEEQAHYERHYEYPDSFMERHEHAYEQAVHKKRMEDEPDHEDDHLHHWITEHSTERDAWTRHAKQPQKVDLRKGVYATQSHVGQFHIDRYLHGDKDSWHAQNGGYTGDYLGEHHPLFVTHEGRLHAIEGHHRVAAALQRGDTHIMGWHHNLDRHPIARDALQPEEECRDCHYHHDEVGKWMEEHSRHHGVLLEKSATWQDVQAKARRMRLEGKVRILEIPTVESPYLFGQVEGDTGVYHPIIHREGNKKLAFLCDCIWGDLSEFGPEGTLRAHGSPYRHRMCSHALALIYSFQSRSMFGRPATLAALTYLHGTNAEFKEGDIVHPSSTSGFQSFDPPHASYSPHHVYTTTSPSEAEKYADRASRLRGGNPHVYEVDPHGEVEKDPETAGVKGWDVNYRSPAARVIREVPYGDRSWRTGKKVRNTEKPQKCNWCKEPATKSYLWAEGMAYIPTCDEHEAKTRSHIEDDENDEVAAVHTVRKSAVIHEADILYEGDHVFHFHQANPKEMGGRSTHTLEAWNPEEAHTEWAKARPEERDQYAGSSFDPGHRPKGSISWHHKTGEIMGVHSEERRKGMATELLRRARETAENTRGVVAPKHSSQRTDAGEAWARSTGDRLPKRAIAWTAFPEGLTYLNDHDPHLGADGTPHRGVMAALVIPYPEELAVEGGEKPRDMHVTLAYLGKKDQVDEDVLHMAIEQFARMHHGLDGTLTGFGNFEVDPETNDGFTHCHVGLMSIPHVDAFRHALVSHLAEHGIHASEQFGLQPHVTIAYAHEPMEYEEMPPIVGKEMQFPCLTVAYGSTWRHYPLRHKAPEV